MVSELEQLKKKNKIHVGIEKESCLLCKLVKQKELVTCIPQSKFKCPKYIKNINKGKAKCSWDVVVWVMGILKMPKFIADLRL